MLESKIEAVKPWHRSDFPTSTSQLEWVKTEQDLKCVPETAASTLGRVDFNDLRQLFLSPYTNILSFNSTLYKPLHLFRCHKVTYI
jgi:hypothetical protein